MRGFKARKHVVCLKKKKKKPKPKTNGMKWDEGMKDMSSIIRVDLKEICVSVINEKTESNTHLSPFQHTHTYE